MSANRPDIVVTGLGAISALGPDVAALTAAVLAGRDGLRAMQRIDLGALEPIRLAGEVTVAPADARHWAVLAAREAVASAGIDPRQRRVAIVSGTTDGEAGDIGSVACAVREALGARGPALTISTACSSSTHAIGMGRDLLVRGDADVVIAGGAERLLLEMFAGFAALGVLSSERCAPFGETVGTTLGEGAGYVVLERRGEREAPARAHLWGYAISSDAFHETSPEPRGEGVARAITAALVDARLAADAIDYVNAHATGTAANDDAEWRGIRKALGPRAEQIPVNGTKGLLGHAQGACGVLELIASLVMIEAGRVPPSVRIGKGRRGGPPLLAPGPPAPSARVRSMLASNAAFGGANAVLAVSLDPPRDVASPARRAVRVAGMARLEAEPARSSEHDLRHSDPATRMLLGATEAALASAAIKVRGALRERAGIFAGASRVSASSVAELRRSIEVGGAARASATAFARSVVHAPTGAVSRFLSLRGPATTLIAEGIAGALAFAEAAEALSLRDDADLLCAVAWDERAAPSEPHGAGCAVLTTTRGSGARVVSCAVAGSPDEAASLARRAALERAALSVEPGATIEARSATGSLEALCALARRVEAEGRAAMIVVAGSAGAVAVVLGPNARDDEASRGEAVR